MKINSKILIPIVCVSFAPTCITPFVVGCSEHYETKDWIDDSNVQLIHDYSDVKDEETNHWSTIIEMPGFTYKGTEKTFDEFIEQARVTKITIFDPDGNLLHYAADGTLYKTNLDNEFGIKFTIHDNGSLKAYTVGSYDEHKYVISELQIKIGNTYIYKKNNELNFCIYNTHFMSRTEGFTFRFPNQQHQFRIEGYEYLHYSHEYTKIEAAMFEWDGSKYVEIDKSETDVAVFSYYEAQHQIQISFNPSVAVWPFDFFIGFYGVKKDGSKELIDPIDQNVKYRIINEEQKKKIGFTSEHPPIIYGGFLYKDWYHDPYGLTKYYFDLNEADGDWNYNEREVPYITFAMYSVDMSFHTNFSKVKFELYSGTTPQEELQETTDYTWYHDEWLSEVRFTPVGKQKILDGITNNLTLVASDFRLEKIHYSKPWGHCSPFFRGVTKLNS
ncbi:MAG: hypothetical protein ACOQNV_01420 [Mycoplasmoidaceae bacterium]